MSKEREGKSSSGTLLHTVSPPTSTSKKSRVVFLPEIGPGLSPLPFQMWRVESAISPILVWLQHSRNTAIFSWLAITGLPLL